MKARRKGVATQMMKFDYFFGVSLGLMILRHTYNLSRMMQKADLSAAEGQVITAMTVSTLSPCAMMPVLIYSCRRSLLPQKILRLSLLPASKTVSTNLYKAYANVQALLLKAASVQQYQEELQFILVFYGADFDSLLLPTHLEILSNSFPAEGKVVLSDSINFFRVSTPGSWS